MARGFPRSPGCSSPRASTLENLANTEEAIIAQCINVNASKAAEILLVAKELLKTRNEQKDNQRQSLGIAGTTKEKAAAALYFQNLADAALFAAEKKD